MEIGYARVSSVGQSLEVQTEALTAAGCEKIFSEKRSGTSTEGRDALADAIDFVREGDTVVVTRLDRLARSAADLHNIMQRLTSKKVGFRCLQQGGMDTTTSTGKLVLSMLAAIAEFETDIRRERQREGIERAKADRSKYRGRKPSVDTERVKALHAEGVKPTDIARRLGIGRASVYRAL